MAIVPDSTPLSLTEEEQALLLRTARESLRSHLEGRPRKDAPEHLGGLLAATCGVFVSLHNHMGERLRGCTGYVEGLKPLHESVVDLAVASAHDRRFQPVTESEVDDLEIEISVLTPLVAVADLSTIEIGKHGLYIRAGASRGLLLPQVATKYGWTVEEFVSHTCEKAGLAFDAWRTEEGIEILSFTAQIFHEPAPHATTRSPA